MPTHLYCLLPAESELEPPPGIRRLAAGDVAAWASTVERGALSRDAREVARATVEHDRVVTAALTRGVTPVPAALADPYSGDDELLTDVRLHARAIRAALERIGGSVEMTSIVAVKATPPADASAGRGRAYLEQLRDAPARAAALADRVTEALGEMGRDPRRRGDNPLALSHLVPRDSVDTYRQLAHDLAVIDGPRAPYSFALYSPRHGMILADSSIPPNS